MSPTRAPFPSQLPREGKNQNNIFQRSSSCLPTEDQWEIPSAQQKIHRDPPHNLLTLPPISLSKLDSMSKIKKKSPRNEWCLMRTHYDNWYWRNFR